MNSLNKHMFYKCNSEGGAVSIFNFIRYILYSLIIFSPIAFGSVPGWAKAIIHLIAVISASLFLVANILNQHTTKSQRIDLYLPIFLISLVVIVSAIFSVHFETSLWASFLFFDYIIFFYLLINIFYTRNQLRQIVSTIIIMGFFISLVGIIYKLSGNNFFSWEYENKLNPGRLTALYVNPDHMAGYMEMAIPLAFGFMTTGINNLKRFGIIIAIFMMFIALVFSLSRGAWLGLASATIFLVLGFKLHRRVNRKMLITMLITLLIVFMIILSSPMVIKGIRSFKDKFDTISDRITVWRGAIDMIKDYPMLGTGPGTFGLVFTQYQPPGLNRHYTMAHNDYLHFTAEVGIFFIPVAIWMVILFYKRGLKKSKTKSRLVKGTTLGAIAGVTAILVHSISDFNLHIPANAILFTILAGIGVGPSVNRHMESRFYDTMNNGR